MPDSKGISKRGKKGVKPKGIEGLHHAHATHATHAAHATHAIHTCKGYETSLFHSTTTQHEETCQPLIHIGLIHFGLNMTQQHRKMEHLPYRQQRCSSLQGFLSPPRLIVCFPAGKFPVCRIKPGQNEGDHDDSSDEGLCLLPPLAFEIQYQLLG